MRTHMTTITQIWMTFLLSNLFLSDHNSDLTLPKCQLVYSFMEHISINVAQLIFEAIHQFVITEPPRHPLGFSALIIGLCSFYGVHVITTKPIRPLPN